MLHYKYNLFLSNSNLNKLQFLKLMKITVQFSINNIFFSNENLKHNEILQLKKTFYFLAFFSFTFFLLLNQFLFVV